MRILSVIARQTAKALISSIDITTTAEVDFDLHHSTIPMQSKTQKSLLGIVLVTDDAVTFRQLLRCRLVSDSWRIPENCVADRVDRTTTLHTLIAEHDCLRILMSQIASGTKVTKEMSEVATYSASIRILQYLHDNNYPMSSELCAIAARWDRAKVLDWLCARGYQCDAYVVTEALLHESIKCFYFVKTVKDNLNYIRFGAIFKNVCVYVRSNPFSKKMIKSLEYFWTNRRSCPGEGKAVIYALEKKSYESAIWQMSNNCPMPKGLCALIVEKTREYDRQRQRMLAIARATSNCTCAGMLHHPQDQEYINLLEF